MKHLGTKQIETERLVLRKFIKNDIELAFKNWMNDDFVTDFLRWPTHTNIITSKNLIYNWINSYKNNNFYQWAIVLKDINEPIGTISVLKIKEQIEMCHIGYCIGSRWWNNGITTEAFLAIIQFLFNEVKVNRIETQHDPNNPSSGKVMIKCGLKYEGTMRQADYNNKGIVDAAVYSILLCEYLEKHRI